MSRLTPVVLSALCACLASSACGAAGRIKKMRELPAGTIAAAPESGKSRIVFLRPADQAHNESTYVFEIRNEVPTLVAILAAKTKVAYTLDPGEHLFMVVGESSDFMSADVLPGQTYHAQVLPRMGAWKTRFSLLPIHERELDDADVQETIERCRWVEKTGESEQWFADNAPSIRKKLAEYYPKWMAKPAASRPRLLSEDGR